MPGYQYTNVGVIPEEWSVDTLASTTPKNQKNGIVDGPFGSNLKTIHYRKSGIPIITSGYVTEGVFNAVDYLYVDADKFNKEKRSAVHPGDIVMAKIGARCGASAILPKSHEIGILSGNALKISVDETRYSTYYIWSVLWNLYTSGKIEQLKTVGAQPAISMANLKKCRVPLPPLKEQHAIAEVLGDVDAFIAALDRLIAKKRTIKQGAMQELLTGKTRLPGFSENWELKAFVEMFDFLQTANNPRKDLLNDGSIKYIHYGDIHSKWNSHLDCANDVFPLIDESRVHNIPFLEDGDLVLADASEDYEGLGKSMEVINATGKKIVAGLHTFLLRGNNTLLANGFKGYMQFTPSLKTSLRELATGISVYGISKNNLKSIQVLIPSLDEQRAIATVLSDLDSEITSIEQERDKVRALKQGLMQELLTGRTRLL